MIYVLNIVSPTKNSDTLYDEVAINLFPIVWVSSNELDSLLKDELFINKIKEIVKSKKIYENAKIFYRRFDDSMDLKEQNSFLLKEKIELESNDNGN